MPSNGEDVHKMPRTTLTELSVDHHAVGAAMVRRKYANIYDAIVEQTGSS